jgi:hypothetical protein
VGGNLLFTYNAEQVAEFGRAVRGDGGYEGFRHTIPMLVFLGFCVYLSITSFRNRLSLLPVLGLLTNLYLMTQLGVNNWLLFFAWLVMGLGVYFGYSYKHSKLSLRS